MPNCLRIVHISAELAPIAKIGGLGDVVLGLSRACKKLGHKIEILIPKYSCLQTEYLKNMEIMQAHLPSFDGETYSVWKGEVEGCEVLFLEPHHPENFFQEGSIYTGKKDISRFTYFSRLALEYLLSRKEEIDVLHLHDWHVALAAPLYKDLYIVKGLKTAIVVINLHNLEHQGKCLASDLDKIGLQGKNYLTPDKLLDDPASHPDPINLLKGGIIYADLVITVSPNYAKEILTVEMAFGLERTLRKHESKIIGILNGVDYDIWNPEKDIHVPYAYSPSQSIKKILLAKKENKKAFQKKIHLSESDSPLISCISRLVPQKGPTLIKEGLLYALQKKAQIALLGTSFLPDIQAEFDHLKEKMRQNPHAFFFYQYNENLSRLMYAASDFIIVPSLFEPCGLTQLIAMRYGAIPIVRRVGGLADTVFDIDSSDIPNARKNGFTFDAFESHSLNKTIDRALDYWYNKQDKYQEILLNGIHMDFAWEKGATEYINAYERAFSISEYSKFK